MVTQLEKTSLLVIGAAFLLLFAILYYTNEMLWNMDIWTLCVMALLIATIIGILYYKFNLKTEETSGVIEKTTTTNPQPDTPVLGNRPPIERAIKQET